MAGSTTTFDGTHKVIRKTPTSSLRLEFEFSNRLASGQTLTGSPTVTADRAGLTIGSPTISGTKVYATVDGGTAGVIYSLTCQCPATSPAENLDISGGISVNSPA